MIRFYQILLIGLSVLYNIYFSSSEQASFDDLVLMGWFGLFQFSLCIYSYTKNGYSIFSPYIIFLVCLYLFSFGQSFLYAFRISPERDLIGYMGITSNQIFRAQVDTLTMLAFFHIGALARQKQSRIVNTISPFKHIIQQKRLKQIGWLLLVISIVPYYIELIRNAILSILFGYGTLYEQEVKIGISNIQSILADYYIPSLLCLFIAYKDSKLPKVLIITTFLFSIFVILVTGGRSEAVILIALLLIFINYFIKKIEKRHLFLLFVGGLWFMVLLSAIAHNRNESNRTLSLNPVGEENAIVDAIAEMGGTMFCLVKTQEIVPKDENYRFGSSYLLSFTTIIPNMGFWDIHPAKKYSDLNEWLTDYLNLSYGSGFSMCAEAYVNFGNLGFLMMFVFGLFTATFFGKFEPAIKVNNYASIAFILIFFWFAIKVPRNSFVGIVRAIFYYALPILWYTRGYILPKRRV